MPPGAVKGAPDERDGEDDFLIRIGGAIDSYTNACRGETLRPVVKMEYRSPMDLFFDGTIYPGGAARLHLLRGWIGEEKFKEAVAHYLEHNAYESVETKQFRASVEAVTGRSWFDWFDQWLYQPGYPELRVQWANQGDGKLMVTVEQVQWATRMAQRYGIQVGMFLMWGYEGETVEDIERLLPLSGCVRSTGLCGSASPPPSVRLMAGPLMLSGS